MVSQPTLPDDEYRHSPPRSDIATCHSTTWRSC